MPATNLSRILFCMGFFSLFVGCKKHQTEEENNPFTETEITSIFPAQAKGGDTIAIRGHRLLGNGAAVKVLVNEKEATIISTSDEEIRAKVPVKAGSGKVSVVVGEETVVGPAFRYAYQIMVSTIAGSGAEGSTDANGTNATFRAPWGIALDDNGDIYIADSYNRLIRKIAAGSDCVSSISIPNTLPGGSFYSPYNLTIDQQTKSLYVTDFNDHVLKRTADGEMTVIFNDPQPLAGIAISPDKKLYIGNNTTGQILRIDTTGANRTIAYSNLITPRNIFFDTSGVMYLAGVGIQKFSATSYEQLMPDPSKFQGWEVVIDEISGGFYMADHFANKIVKMEPDGTIIDIAGNGVDADIDGPGPEASFDGPSGLAIDKQGNLYVTTYNYSRGTGNKLRKVTIH